MLKKKANSIIGDNDSTLDRPLFLTHYIDYENIYYIFRE